MLPEKIKLYFVTITSTLTILRNFARNTKRTFSNSNILLFFEDSLDIFLGEADVEREFSLNKKLIFENMKSLIAQRFPKDHLLFNDYNLHDMSIVKELITSVEHSSAA